MGITYKLADQSDLPALIAVGDKLFDHPVKASLTERFLNDPRHHLMLAYSDDQIVGMASGFHYLHPDKEEQLFINEVGVLEDFQGAGICKQLIKEICEHGRTLGCTEMWVATEVDNLAARKCYSGANGLEESSHFVSYTFE